MKEVSATSHFNITVDCPHCGNYQYVTNRLTECLDSNSLSASELEEVITCEKCNEEFMVTEIEY